MVKDKHLGGVQLNAPMQGTIHDHTGYVDKDEITDEFLNLLNVNNWYVGIPHFALIDPEGKIVDAFFYRASDKKAAEYISELFDLKS